VKRRLVIPALLALAALAGIAIAASRGSQDDAPDPATSASPQADARTLERGQYLAQAGNCIACHTRQGGASFAGGRGIETPFGVVYAPNITPDPKTGIGAWSAADFWRAMHQGRSKDGRLLYPAFPYPNFTQVTREDSDAIYLYLRSLPAVAQANREHALSFPYSTQAALAVWRALYFKPASFELDARKSVQWNRGRYLVQGLGHCATCHSSRNFLGGIESGTELSGGMIPGQNWYAPPLAVDAEFADLLKKGTSRHGAVMGPMAEVVFRSTQHLSEQDLASIETFLADVPKPVPAASSSPKRDRALLGAGRKIYENRCASCHGNQGEGVPGAYPALADNRTVTSASPVNVVRAIVLGGMAPTTAGNPRPYGMPPFGAELNDAEIAAVSTFVRSAWGNDAPTVSAVEVLRAR